MLYFTIVWTRGSSSLPSCRCVIARSWLGQSGSKAGSKNHLKAFPLHISDTWAGRRKQLRASTRPIWHLCLCVASSSPQFQNNKIACMSAKDSKGEKEKKKPQVGAPVVEGRINNQGDNVDKSTLYYAHWKKPDSKGYTMYDFIYITFRKGKIIRGEKNNQWLPGSGGWVERLTSKEYKGIVWNNDISIPWLWRWLFIYLSGLYFTYCKILLVCKLYFNKPDFPSPLSPHHHQSN